MEGVADGLLPILPGGVRPHLCQYCEEVEIGPRQPTPEYQAKVLATFMLAKVCEGSNSGCRLFRGQLKTLLLNSLSDPHSRTKPVDGALEQICEAFIAERLDQLDPSNHSLTVDESWRLMSCELKIEWSSWPEGGELYFQWYDKDGTELGPSRSLKLFALQGSPPSREIRETPLKSKVDLDKARTWLQQCQLTHRECSRKAKQTAGAPGPKRLVFLGSPSDPAMRLEETGAASTRHYAALSYCWGSSVKNFFKTTRETLASRLQGFTLSELPKTLQDAVTAARALGLQHLWVDALCIVQDDTEEMNLEISRMCDIYRNASVTISASRAEHSDEGFLHDRDLQTTDDNTFAIRWTDDSVGGDQPEGQMVFCTEAEIRRYVPDLIDKRAWTMQEHDLSLRLLRFGQSQMVWTCLGSTFVDGGSDEKPQLENNIDPGLPELEAINQWHDNVAKFTARDIGNVADRLPAIAAIAEVRASEMNAEPSDYLAGLWRQFLPLMLLWCIESGNASEAHPAPPMDQRSPTWSWHAARSKVCWPQFIMSDYLSPASALLTVQSYAVLLEDDNVKYGRVKAASLTVQGVLLRLCWSRELSGWFAHDDPRLTCQVRITWDFYHEPSDRILICLEVVETVKNTYEGLVLVEEDVATFSRVGHYERTCPDGFVPRSEGLQTTQITLI